jgi:peptidoglycan LD-endopeptidase LytH
VKRALLITICIAIVAAVLFAARAPMQRMFTTVYTVVRLWREELRPPLLVPVKGVRPKGLYDSWGEPRSGGRTHEGIDIFAPCGRPVVSATEGIVFSVGENHLGGHVVFVFGPGGTWQYYAHLSRFGNVRRGDHVQAGDILGYVGHTGNAAGTPCHLHYGIYFEGKAHDPYPYLVP